METMRIPIFKMLFRYMRARGSEGSTWAGLSVLALFLNQLTGYELDGLMSALAEAMPSLLTGNWLGFAIVVLPAIVAVLKQDRKDSDAPAPANAGWTGEGALRQPQPGAPVPPGARTHQPQGGPTHGTQTQGR